MCVCVGGGLTSRREARGDAGAGIDSDAAADAGTDAAAVRVHDASPPPSEGRVPFGRTGSHSEGRGPIRKDGGSPSFRRLRSAMSLIGSRYRAPSSGRGGWGARAVE